MYRTVLFRVGAVGRLLRSSDVPYCTVQGWGRRASSSDRPMYCTVMCCTILSTVLHCTVLSFRRDAAHAALFALRQEGEAFRCLLYVHPVLDTAGSSYCHIGVQFDVSSGLCGGQPVDDKLLQSMEERLKVSSTM
eukprot:4121006-Pyramimonas_sp.AAC.1